MTKRKKGDPVAELLTAVLVLAVVATFLTTQSLWVTAFVGIALFFVMLTVQNVFRLKREGKIRESGILQVDKMTGVQFEEYLRILYSSAGYQVKTTPASGDFGADLILEKGGRRIAVQAKRYKTNVGIKAVQEIASAKTHYKANEAWVVTNSHFTKAADTLAESNGVKLVGREQLISCSLAVKKAIESRQQQKVKAAG